MFALMRERDVKGVALKNPPKALPLETASL